MTASGSGIELLGIPLSLWERVRVRGDSTRKFRYTSLAAHGDVFSVHLKTISVMTAARKNNGESVRKKKGIYNNAQGAADSLPLPIMPAPSAKMSKKMESERMA